MLENIEYTWFQNHYIQMSQPIQNKNSSIGLDGALPLMEIISPVWVIFLPEKWGGSEGAIDWSRRTSRHILRQRRDFPSPLLWHACWLVLMHVYFFFLQCFIVFLNHIVLNEKCWLTLLQVHVRNKSYLENIWGNC